MKYREFISLSEDEITQIVTDIFGARKVTCIKKYKETEVITCKIYMEQYGQKWVDIATLRNPFRYDDLFPISTKYDDDFYSINIRYDNLKDKDKLLKQFCIAKGIYPELIKNNQYLK